VAWSSRRFREFINSLRPLDDASASAARWRRSRRQPFGGRAAAARDNKDVERASKLLWRDHA
jgi:hypothetical protein